MAGALTATLLTTGLLPVDAQAVDLDARFEFLIAEALEAIDADGLERDALEALTRIDEQLRFDPDNPLLLAQRARLVAAAAAAGITLPGGNPGAGAVAFPTALETPLVPDGRAAFAGDAVAALSADREATTPVAMDPPYVQFDPIAIEAPTPVVDGNSLKMARTYSNLYSLHLTDVVVGDLNGDGWDDIVSVGFGQADAADADAWSENRDVYVMVNRADRFGGFEPGIAYPLGYKNQQTQSFGRLALGDVDDDGDLDIVAGARMRREIVTLLNDGDGTYPWLERTSVAHPPDGSVVVADLAGDDEYPDVVFTSADSGVTSVLRGNGDGTFAPDSELTTPSAYQVTVADIDGDGTNDLLVPQYAYNTSDRLKLWQRDTDPESDTAGQWLPTTLTAPRPTNLDVVDLHAVAAWAGDIDGDGDVDVVALGSTNSTGAFGACVQTGTVQCARVLLNDATGQLVGQPEVYAFDVANGGSYVDEVRVGGTLYDLDGDGNLDVVAPDDYSGYVGVLFGNGDGTFEEMVAWNALPNLTPPGGWSVEEATGWTPGHGLGISAVVPIDLDGPESEGLPGLAAASFANSPPASGLHGGSNGRVATIAQVGPRQPRTATGSHVVPTAAGWARLGTSLHAHRTRLTHYVDWDGDGIRDVVIVGDHPNDGPTGGTGAWGSLMVRRGRPPVNGRPADFGPTEIVARTPADCYSSSVGKSSIADLDGDGALDVVCGYSDVFVLYGDGHGGLRRPDPDPAPAVDNYNPGNDAEVKVWDIPTSPVRAHEIIDLDRDGRDDIVLAIRAGTAPYPMQIWVARQSAEQGSYGPRYLPGELVHSAAPIGSYSDPWNTTDVTVADVTGDGLVDFLMATRGSTPADPTPTLAVYAQVEAPPGELPTFDPMPQSPTGFPLHFGHIQAADLDDDGDLDLIATHTSEDVSAQILLNDGSGVFPSAAVLEGNIPGPRPVVVDLDGDEIVDLAFTTWWRGVEVRKGRGDGTFGPAVTVPTGSEGTNWLAVGDLDRDGRPDLITGWHQPGGVFPGSPQLGIARNVSTGDESPANLVVQSVTVGTPSAATSKIDAVVANNGGYNAPAGFTTTFWLSADDVWDAGDELLGEFTHRVPVPPGGSSTATLTTGLVPLVDGTQHVIVRTDARRSVPESDENDNSAGTEIDIEIAELAVGGPAVSVVASTARAGLLRLTTGGTPVRVSVEPVGSATVLSVAARSGQVPTATQRDASRNGPGTFVVPGDAGTTYLRIEGTGTISVSAVGLPFGAGSVSPRAVGNTGPVTLLITGTGLHAGLTAQLQRSGNAPIAATAVSLASDGTLSATFPLEGRSVGSYDLTVTDGVETSTLPDAVSVQTPPATYGNLGVDQFHLATFAPSEVFGGSVADYVITFGNRGLTDLVAPFLIVHVEGATSPSGSSYDFSEPIWIVPEISGAPAGVIPPGATGRVRIPFHPASPFGFMVETYSAQTTDPYDWARELRNDPPPGLPQGEYDAVMDELVELVGATSGSYVAAAQRVRAELLAEGVRIDDLGELRAAMIDRIVDGRTEALLRGHLEAADGFPLAGRTIEASDGTRTLYAASGFDGSFAFRDPAGDPATGEWTFRVVGYGPAPVAVIDLDDAGVDPDDLALSVPAWPALHGRVTRPEGGAVEGATVIVRHAATGLAVATLTEDDGSYRFDGVSPGEMTVVAVTEGGASSVTVELTVGAQEIEQDFELLAGGTVAGSVTVAGAPVAGADVTVRSAAGESSAVTTAAGAFSIGGLAPGPVTVVVTADGFAASAVDAVVESAETVSTGAIELRPAATVTGRVVDDSGDPLSGVAVGIAHEPVDSTSTVADGTFTLDAVPHGDVSVVFDAAGRVPHAVDVTIAVPEADLGDVTLRQAYALVIEVTDGAGPVAGAGVMLVDASGEVRSVTTGTDGSVTVDRLAAGAYLASSGRARASVTVPSVGPVQLVAAPDHTITGRVVDADDEPVVDAAVIVRVGTDAAARVARTGDDGTFTAGVAANTAVQLLIVDVVAGHRRVVLGAADTDPGETTDVGDLGPTGGAVSVTIPADLADEPAVLALAPAGLNPAAASTYATYDPADPGPVVFDGVPDGDYVLRYEGAVVFQQPVDVVGPTVALLTAPPFAPLAGIARDRLGDPLAGAYVTAWNEDIELLGVSDADGAWNLGLVPIGSWTVAISHDDHGVVSIQTQALGGPTPLRGAVSPVGFVPRQVGSECPSSTITGHLDGPIREVPVAVTINAVDALGRTGAVATVQPDRTGEFVSPELPDGTYEVVPHEAAHVVQSAGQGTTVVLPPNGGAGPEGFVRQAAGGCNADVGPLPVPTPVSPPEQPLSLSGAVQELIDELELLFSTWWNVPDPADMLEISAFEPPESTEPDCPPPPPAPQVPPPCPAPKPPSPPAARPCAGEAPDPPSPPDDSDDAEDDDAEAEAYLLVAKRHASAALDIHKRWDASLGDVADESARLTALLAMRGVIVLNEVTGMILSTLKLLAYADEMADMAKWLEAIDEALDEPEFFQTLWQLMNALGRVKSIRTELTNKLWGALRHGEVGSAQAEMDLLKAVVSDVAGIAASALTMIPAKRWAGKFAKTIGGMVPIVSALIAGGEQLNGALSDFQAAYESVKALERQMAEYPKQYAYRNREAHRYYAAYWKALTNQKNKGKEGFEERPLPPLPPGLPGPKGPDCGWVFVSRDPNEIHGPAGYGDQRWLQPGSGHAYKIRFENLGPGSDNPEGLPLAEAPAGVVDVELPLDPAFDLATFELGRFGFGAGEEAVVFEPPIGAQSYEEVHADWIEIEVPGPDGLEQVSLTLRGRAWLDHPTRTAHWRIELFDPATGVRHSAPAAGFLPPEPEDDPGAGQGYAELFVNTTASATTGTTVSAGASIVFDTNEAIETNVWTNRLDRTAPVASMVSTSATTPIGSQIAWGGSDQGAGIARYDVYRSVNGGPLALWLDDTPATEVTFNGTVGWTYGFAVAAVDGAGNAQAAPTDIQWTTTAVEQPTVTTTAPSAPRSVKATAGNGIAKVTWQAPASNGGSPVTGYTVSASPGSRTCTTTAALTCTVTGLTNGTAYTFRVRATNAAGTSAWSPASSAVTPKAPSTTKPVDPTPVDPKPFGPPVLGTGAIAPSGRVCFDLAGSPGDVAVVNLTPVGATGLGDGQLVSSGVEPPVASNVNMAPGLVDPNVALARIGADGRVCFVNSWHSSVHLVADHLATIKASAITLPTANGASVRKVDTRRALGGGLVGPSGRVCFEVAGSPGDVAVVNLTPVGATGLGDGQLVSSGVEPPLASNVNFELGSVDPNVALARIGDDGRVCYVNSWHSSVHLVADHLATIKSSGITLAGANGAPVRQVDTRRGLGGGLVARSGRVCFEVAGSPGDVAVVNLTPVGASGLGDGQLVSSGVEPPVASNVNFAPGSVDPNVALARIGADGKVCYVNSRHSSVHLVADHLATIKASAIILAAPSGAPARRVDTRPAE